MWLGEPMPRRLSIVAFVALVGMLMSMVAGGQRPARGAAALAPGCAPARPAVAHYAGGAILHPQPSGGPIPCGVSTGFPGGETRIGVDNDGAALTMAVYPRGLAGLDVAPQVFGDSNPNSQFSGSALTVTRDLGSTWRPSLPLGRVWAGQDTQLYVDRVTGRVFYEAYNPSTPTQPGLAPTDISFSGYLFFSDDDGATWTLAFPPAGHTLPENPRFVSDVAPPGQPSPQGYPEVVYWCADVGNVFLPEARDCARSLDGGLTWERTAIILNRLSPVHPQCGSSGEQITPVDGSYPEAGPNGSLYLVVACGGKQFLARSTDEAATFPVIHALPPLPASPSSAGGDIAGSSYELRTDPAGNLYLFWAGPGKIYMRISRDGGATWTGPADLTAPGVTDILKWFVAVRDPGTAVVSYLAQRKGQTGYDGYLTETRNALAPEPVFWSAVVNDPARPLLYGSSWQGAGAYYLPDGTPVSALSSVPLFGVTNLDFIGADVGPDGGGWGSFAQDCGPNADAQQCRVQHGQTRGFVGRLSWPTP